MSKFGIKHILLVIISIIFAMQFGSCHMQESDTYNVPLWDRPTLRILAIGNSFSIDAVEQNLYELAAAAGYNCEIGNLYIGGCSLERHVSNIESDAKAYEYRKVDFYGKLTVRNETSIRDALCDGEWDFVSVQQVSSLSGLYETYAASLPALTEYIEKYCPTAEIVIHQTWAYSEDSDHEGFANYGRDQQKMYEAIVSSVRRAASEFGIEQVIPAGTAIQNMRLTSVGDNLDRDGYHLNPLGRFTAACVWLESLFEVDVRENGYESPLIDVDLQKLAKKAAHAAVLSPYSITIIDE